MRLLRQILSNAMQLRLTRNSTWPPKRANERRKQDAEEWLWNGGRVRGRACRRDDKRFGPAAGGRRARDDQAGKRFGLWRKNRTDDRPDVFERGRERREGIAAPGGHGDDG